jgi:RNA polymerase sigma factor (sigma-70 family)
MQAFLRGFEDVDPPDLNEAGGFRHWHFGVRWLYEPVAQYLNHHEVRSVCRTAVEQLPRRQREVIRGEFYDDKTPIEIAEAQGVSRSTVYNSKAQALANLGSDDRFFTWRPTISISAPANPLSSRFLRKVPPAAG